MTPPDWVGPAALALALFNLGHTCLLIRWGYRPPVWCMECGKRQAMTNQVCKSCREPMASSTP